MFKKRLFSNIITIPTNKYEQFIENINKPKCKNCIYFNPFKNKNTDENIIYNKSSCTKFGSADIITGKIKYLNIIDVRYDINKCGKDAKYFMSKLLYTNK
jgi:hypothetical protein